MESDTRIDYNKLKEYMAHNLVATINVSVPSGQVYHFPMKAHQILLPLKIYRRSEIENEPDVEMKEILNFGEINMFSEKTLSLIVANPNLIKLPFRVCSTNNSFFEVEDIEGIIAPEERLEQVIVMKKMEAEGEDIDIPERVEHAAQFQLTCAIADSMAASVDLVGVLVDLAEFSFPKEFDFGEVFYGDEVDRTYEFQNPLRRRLTYDATLEQAYQDIFRVAEGDKGVLKFRNKARITVRFSPLSNTPYASTMTVTTDHGVHQIECKGKGITPSMSFNVDGGLDFGTVCVGHPESKTFEITNTCLRAYKVNIEPKSPGYKVVPSSVELPPNQPVTITLTFDPMEVHERYLTQISFSTVITEKVAPFFLGEFEVNGYGGKFEAKLPTLTEDGTLAVEKLALGLTHGKTFVLANEGDGNLDVEVVDMFGDALMQGETIRGEMFELKIAPLNAVIPPHEKMTFHVVTSGLVVGDEELHFAFRTRNFAEPVTIPVNVKAHVEEAGLLGLLRLQLKKDMSIEKTVNLDLIEQSLYNDDEYVWKLLRPIVRVAAVKPSEEFREVPAVEVRRTDRYFPLTILFNSPRLLIPIYAHFFVGHRLLCLKRSMSSNADSRPHKLQQ
jgi:hypothetical protein